jgi:gamma-glutamyltranspeptidase
MTIETISVQPAAHFLAGVGYKLVEQRPWGAVVLIEVENGRLFGASDPRQPAGAAVAY